MEIIGKEIALLPYTIHRCNDFWKEYVSDHDMLDEEFIYHKNWVNKYYKAKVLDENRRFFAICRNGKTVGEIQLKRINFNESQGTLSIHFSNDNYKNKGWGTEAEELLINYAFNSLELNVIYADAIIRNKRSQHVLEKLGFIQIHEDEKLRYYKLEK